MSSYDQRASWQAHGNLTWQASNPPLFDNYRKALNKLGVVNIITSDESTSWNDHYEAFDLFASMLVHAVTS